MAKEIEVMDWEGGSQAAHRSDMAELVRTVKRAVSLSGADLGRQVLDGAISTRNRLGGKETEITQSTQQGGVGGNRIVQSAR